ncbi:MAG: PIN domain-containing protein [Acidimicrobiia bacterium]|nr:PIN domain-containing protein [Acidimicrobiia bacterium]MYG57166.1 PIN domain-containing protein [Acidimicrobiia bacterium]MYH96809.1 PIN domain-containing protein [Acidimicrobiia bacterium]MYJ31418.1 PIN domain-containing protein [Acidimicrobiia bacterium]
MCLGTPFMNAVRFVDTNILLYAVSALSEDSAKRGRALALLENGDLALSVQVIQEFYVQATRPSRADALTAEQALRFLEAIDSFPVQPVTEQIFRQAVIISQRFGLSYWDSAILAAADAMGCEIVLSEDMSSEQDYDGIRVVNPFEDSRAES